MSYTINCHKCSVGILSFDYQSEQAYGLEQEPIAEAFVYEGRSCDCPYTDAEIEQLEDQAMQDAKDSADDGLDDDDYEEFRFRLRL